MRSLQFVFFLDAKFPTLITSAPYSSKSFMTPPDILQRSSGNESHKSRRLPSGERAGDACISSKIPVSVMESFLPYDPGNQERFEERTEVIDAKLKRLLLRLHVLL
jgi:hypothetical protein